MDKVYEIYSGQPKKFGMTVWQQMAGLLGIVVPLWLEKYWLLLFIPLAFVIIMGLLTKDEENIIVRLRNYKMPNFIRGRLRRHTFTGKLLGKHDKLK